MKDWNLNQMAADKKDLKRQIGESEFDLKELSDKVAEIQKSFSVNTTTTGGYMPGTPIPGHQNTYPQYGYGQQPIFQPQPVPLPNFNLGSEEDNAELLAMLDCLGIKPTEDYLTPDIKIAIGEKWYSFTELLVKQMQFMTHINLLLCHQGLEDDEN